MKHIVWMFIPLLCILGCKPEETRPEEYTTFFDDFVYNSTEDLSFEAFGWHIREGAGGPGVTGARWLKENVRIDSLGKNGVLVLSSKTSGKSRNTYQSEIYHRQNYLEGTYAARIFFTDSPVNGGPDGDQLVQTFFAISPLAFDLDPDYSETDFAEYLPNGGWGETEPAFWMTTWETYRADPWLQDAQSDFTPGSFAGWHVVSATVNNGEVKYYIDGKLLATHGSKYYPEQLMYLSFNLWFIQGGLLSATSERTYQQKIDWVYFTDTAIKNPAILPDIVEKLRENGVVRRDDWGNKPIEGY